MIRVKVSINGSTIRFPLLVSVIYTLAVIRGQCNSKATISRIFLLNTGRRQRNLRQPLNAVKSADDNVDLRRAETHAITSGLLSRDVPLQVSPRDFHSALACNPFFAPSSSFATSPRLSLHLSSPLLSPFSSPSRGLCISVSLPPDLECTNYRNLG